MDQNSPRRIILRKIAEVLHNHLVAFNNELIERGLPAKGYVEYKFCIDALHLPELWEKTELTEEDFIPNGTFILLETLGKGCDIED